MADAIGFDTLADEYDAAFTDTTLGSLLRGAVWQRLDANFATGDHVLELGCGTGTDAIHLAQRGVAVNATDASGAMVAQAARKVEAHGLAKLVRVGQADIDDLASAPLAGTRFDGVFANFGALNCAADLETVATTLHTRLRPGAAAVFCVMGPIVPWEWVYFLARRQPEKAWRRLRPDGTTWRGLRVRYPSVRAVRRAFARGFEYRRASGLGAVLPPTYAAAWLDRHPLVLGGLARWERRFERWPPVVWLADHYIIELDRR